MATVADDLIQKWDSYELISLLTDDRAQPPDSFWLSFFTQSHFSERKTIVFEELPILDRRMAPYVMPHVQGRVMREPGLPGLRSFEPAYVKPKHTIEPSMTINRLPGEPLGGNLSRQERFDRLTAQRLMSQANMIRRRWEWQAAQAAIYGYVDIVGDDYPAVTVDYLRDGSLDITLSGAALWSAASTAKPLEDIAGARDAAFKFGRSPVNTIIMGTAAWAAFRTFPELKELLTTQYRLPGNANFNITGFGTGEPVQQVGSYALPDGGIVTFWVYANTMVDPVDGTSKALLDPRDVVGLGGAMTGVRAFGAIEDLDAGMQAIDIFPKQWREDDPSGMFLMSQSAPLMVVANPNNTFRMRVLA